MSRERFACGCTATEREWIAQCVAHRAEHDAYHAAMLAQTQPAAHDEAAITQEG
jgi:hypothetical protein